MRDIEIVISPEDAERGAPPPPADPFSEAHQLWTHQWAPIDPMEPDWRQLARNAEDEHPRFDAEQEAVQ